MFEFTDLDFSNQIQIYQKLAKLAADNKIEGVFLNLSLIDCSNPLIAHVVSEILENESIKIIQFRAMTLKNIELLTDKILAAHHLAIIKVSVADLACKIVFFTKLLSLPNTIKVIEEKYEINAQEDHDPASEKCVLIKVTPQFSNPVRALFLDQNFTDETSELDRTDELTGTQSTPFPTESRSEKPKKKVSFGDEKPEGILSRIKPIERRQKNIRENFDLVNESTNLDNAQSLRTASQEFGADKFNEMPCLKNSDLVNEAANNGNAEFLRIAFQEHGAIKFNEMLCLPSGISLFEGYRTLHFVVEGRRFKLIKLLHSFAANFLVTITNSKNDTDGFIPFQLATYKTDAQMMLAFSAVEDRVFKPILHYVCIVGKYRGYQALHIALAKLTDQENIGGAPLTHRQNVVDMLKQWGADLSFKINNPDSPWHGKNATEILDDIEQLRIDDSSQLRRGMTP